MTTVDRRTLLRAGVGAAALTALAACGKQTDTSAGNAGVKLPSYVPFQGGPKPDLPSPGEGMLDGFLKYPAEPVKVAGSPPGDGKPISAFLQTYNPVAPGLDNNKYWQALNKALGADLKVNVVPSGDYPTKFAALSAGDLPDLLHVRTNVVDVPGLLAAKCQDLSPYLSGDAIKEYPFLANIPTAGWKVQCVHNGGIYGVPVPRATLGTTFFRRDDLIAAKGLDPDPKSFADFQKLCAGLTDTRSNTWAITAADAAWQIVQQMMGVPNMGDGGVNGIGGWFLKDGKLVNTFELEQTKQSLSDVAGLVAKGYVHPDSFASSSQDLTTNFKQWFNAGSAAIHGDNFPAWWQFYTQNVAGPSFKVGAIVPPNYDSGSKAVTWMGNPGFSYTAFKKGDEGRIRALLKVVNWLAAPYGTAEYLLKIYGVENVDWARDPSGDAVLNKTGYSEVMGLGTQYIVAAPYVLYYAGQPQATKDLYEFQKKFVPMAVQDPTLGMDSKTKNRQSGPLAAKLVDARHAIMRGQQPVSSWDDVMKDFRANGGDTIRGELQDLLQKNGG
jgi:putative aldouronate transport system substrate-binding protein